MPQQSPSQTVGPFFKEALIDHIGEQNELVNEQTAGQWIYVRGRIIDGAGEPVDDGMVEIWQADANGYFDHELDPNREKADPNFKGFGRSQTLNEGWYWFKTVKPGGMNGAAPHINVRVFSRGMLIHAVTRLYFADEATANENDEILGLVPMERWPTLIATLMETADLPTYRFDIVLQGENETVFFDA